MTDVRMPAITVRPPWSQIIAETAALRVLGVVPKLVENRGRPVSSRFLGADFAIHAGKTWDEDAEDDPRVRRAWSVFARAIDPWEANPLLTVIGDDRTGAVGALTSGNRLWIPRGAVVAVATLAGCHQAVGTRFFDGRERGVCCAPWGALWHNEGPAYHLIFDSVRRLPEPVDGVRGALPVPFTLPEEPTTQVHHQLAVLAAAGGGS